LVPHLSIIILLRQFALIPMHGYCEYSSGMLGDYAWRRGKQALRKEVF
jgi:hypothetical protein